MVETRKLSKNNGVEVMMTIYGLTSKKALRIDGLTAAEFYKTYKRS